MRIGFLALALFVGLSRARGLDGPALTNLSVVDFGAVPDGVTVNTIGMQKAIDLCSQKGGGTVTVPAGRFVTGTLQLKDGVTLSLAENAVLLGSTNVRDYQNLDPFHSGSDGSEELGYALIIGKDVRNAGLAGLGTIDGRGTDLKKSEGRYNRRPFLVRWVRCDGVSVRDVKLTGSGAWTMDFFQSQNVVVNHVSIQSRGLSNNDGIDMDSSHSIQINDCDIDSGDDSICFKATSPVSCYEIRVDGCTIHSGEAAIKFGTESMGDFENITISHCKVLGATGGIKIFSVDGAHIHDLQFSDIKMEKVNLPIMIRLGSRLKVFRPGEIPLPTGEIDGVECKDIEARDFSNIGLLISGIPGHPVRNVAFENIRLDLSGTGTQEDAAAVLPEDDAAYPEINMFGPKMPVSGIYLRHVAKVKLNGIVLTLGQPDLRPLVACLDGEDVEFSVMTFPNNPTWKNFSLETCRRIILPAGTDVSQQVDQQECTDVTVGYH